MTTNTTNLTIDYTSPTTYLATDPRAAMARAIHAARAVMAELDSGNADAPTPCSEWNALDVARHMIAVVDRATAGPSGRPLDGMAELADVDLADVEATIAESSRAFEAAWADDRALQVLLPVPWGTFPGAAILATYTADLLVHVWDLSVAIGVELNWPAADVANSLQMAQAGFPDTDRDHLPFDAVVRPAPDAPGIEHLAGWVGRRTSEWQASS